MNPGPCAGHDRHTPPHADGSGSRSGRATAGTEVSTSGDPARRRVRIVDPAGTAGKPVQMNASLEATGQVLVAGGLALVRTGP
jgi:hypothetical protein